LPRWPSVRLAHSNVFGGSAFADITLARYGIGMLVIDKREGVSTFSRTLVISTRGMELMRRWGLEDEVRSGRPMSSRTPGSLACREGTEMSLGYPSDKEAAAVSPCRPAWAPQDHHEPILLAHLRQLPSATVRFRCELTGLSQDEAGVCAVLLDRLTATTSQVGVQYVIASAGAQSRVREQLGIGMEALITLPTMSGSSSPHRSPTWPGTAAMPFT
jgi:putative polyketide hydroxylase